MKPARQSVRSWRNYILLSFVPGLMIAACSRATTTSGGSSFIPPTVAPLPTSTAAPVSTPTSSIDCTDTLSFESDITIPDGTEVKPGQELDKRWQVRNNGSCDWNEKYSIHLIAGEALGSPSIQSLFPARSGSAAVIRMVLTAPSEAGTYRSAWQAYNLADQPFGDPFYIEIVVKE